MCGLFAVLRSLIFQTPMTYFMLIETLNVFVGQTFWVGSES